MFCTECGKPLMGSAPKFCASCGSPVEAVASVVGDHEVEASAQPAVCRVGPCEKSPIPDSPYCALHASIPVVHKGRAKKPVEVNPYKGTNSSIICPHCQTKGSVKTWRADQKTGIDGEKAGMAVITGGLSVFATGLSGSRGVTRAKCLKCGVKWDM